MLEMLRTIIADKIDAKIDFILDVKKFADEKKNKTKTVTFLSSASDDIFFFNSSEYLSSPYDLEKKSILGKADANCLLDMQIMRD